jgi:hypothetical protein
MNEFYFTYSALTSEEVFGNLKSDFWFEEETDILGLSLAS